MSGKMSFRECPYDDAGASESTLIDTSTAFASYWDDPLVSENYKGEYLGNPSKVVRHYVFDELGNEVSNDVVLEENLGFEPFLSNSRGYVIGRKYYLYGDEPRVTAYGVASLAVPGAFIPMPTNDQPLCINPKGHVYLAGHKLLINRDTDLHDNDEPGDFPDWDVAPIQLAAGTNVAETTSFYALNGQMQGLGSFGWNSMVERSIDRLFGVAGQLLTFGAQVLNNSGNIAGNFIPAGQIQYRPTLAVSVDIIGQQNFVHPGGIWDFVHPPGQPAVLFSKPIVEISALDFAFDSSDLDYPLKSTDWIEEDWDRFYVRTIVKHKSGQGPLRARVWTDSPGTGYDDDPRTGPTDNVVELYEEGSTGVFVSKSMILVSNDGDDDHMVDGIADDALNDRTRKIALEGKLKVELLLGKTAPTYIPDVESEVPVLAVVNLKRWISTIGGVQVVPDPSSNEDLKVAQEIYAQVGVKLVDYPGGIIKFEHTDAGMDLDGFAGVGEGYDSSEPLSGEAQNLFDWIDLYSQRASDEISIIYVNDFTSNYFGMSYISRAFPTLAPEYLNHCIVGAQKNRYTFSHELLHVLLNAKHPEFGGAIPDYDPSYRNPRMTWSKEISTNSGSDILGRKRISKRKADPNTHIGTPTYRSQASAILSNPYAK